LNNKIFFAIIGILLLVGGILGVLTFNSDSASAYLTKDEAKDKIQTQFPGEIVELELDEERNKKVYEVDIKGSDRFYELEIDAETGEVLKIEEKLFNNQKEPNNQKNDDIPEVNVSQADDQDDQSKQDKKETKKVEANDDKDEENKSSKKSSIISIDKAKSIAKGLFNGKIDEIELDDDDGLRYYEIEMYSSTEEAELKINAYTGELISISKEKHEDDDDD